MDRFVIDSIKVDDSGGPTLVGNEGELYSPPPEKPILISLKSCGEVELEHLFKAYEQGKKVTLIIEE